MATGSPQEAWASPLNATSPQYRSLSAHLEKGLPLLVGDDQDAVRARRGQKTHREANSLGEEFRTIADPGQTNDLAQNIMRVETAWFSAMVDSPSAIRPIYKYMYLARDQEWRLGHWVSILETSSISRLGIFLRPRYGPFRILLFRKTPEKLDGMCKMIR